MQRPLRFSLLFLCPLVSLLLAASACGQNVELGATVGFGAAGAGDLSATPFVSFGAELCALCRGRFAIFVEYNHWEPSSTDFSRTITSLNVFGAGLRIQGGKRVRPFFDAGFAAATDSYTYYMGFGAPSATGRHTNPGFVLGGGAAIHIGGRFYVRPQLRVIVARGYHYAAGGGAGFGITF